MTLAPSLVRGAANGARTRDFITDRVVVDESGCWIWQRHLCRRGYARAPHGVNARYRSRKAAA